MEAKTKVTLAASVLVVVGAIAVVALAQDGAGGEAEPGDGDAARRVEVNDTEDGVAIHLVAEDEAADARDVSLAYDVSNATLSLAHGDESVDEDGSAGLEVVLDRLLEYGDADENGTYEPGEPIASAWPLSASGDEDGDAERAPVWGSPIVTNETRGGVEGKRVVVPAQIGEGSIELRFLAFGQDVEVGNASLGPTGVKIDLAVLNYPYEGNGTDLALSATFRTPFRQPIATDHRPTADERGVAVTREQGDRAITYVFAWGDTARVDGRAEAVEAQRLDLREDAIDDEETEQERRRTGENDTRNRSPEGGPGRGSALQPRRLAISYERGDNIVHDPRTEVVVESIEGSEDVPAGLATPLVAALAAAGLLGRRARRP